MTNDTPENPKPEDDQKTVLGKRGDTAKMPIVEDTGTADVRRHSTSSTGGTTEDDRFTLTQVLGEGSQGEVCRAFDNHLQREVAIKFPHRRSDMKPADILDEARKAARLNHPNAVTIYECGFWQGRPFICMELVEGVSLATLIKDVGRLSVERWARYMNQILSALGAAHRSGIIHRDLKPQNVIVARDGSLKLTDFGIAHVAKGPKTRNTSVHNVLAGTPMYMSPEQWDGKSPDVRSDIYALGCMSYVMLTGRGPFTGRDIMSGHLTEAPPGLRDRVPNLPVSVDRLVRRCIAKAPQERFQSCGELESAIEQALRETESVVISEPEKKGSFPIKTVALLAILGAGGWFFGVQEKGVEIRGKAMAALGLASAEKTTDSDKKTDGNEGSGAKPTPEDDIARERRLEGEGLLEKARNAATPEERWEFARQAVPLLDGPARTEAQKIVTDSEAAIRNTNMTESNAAVSFSADLAEARKLMTEDDPEGALLVLDRARETMTKHRSLQARMGEWQSARLPVLAKLADLAGRRGDFDEASDLFDKSSKLADFVKQPGYSRNLAEDSRQTARLRDCRRELTIQPRRAALVLEDLADDAGLRYPAVGLMRAQLSILLDRPVEATAILNSLDNEGNPEEIRREAQALLKGLR